MYSRCLPHNQGKVDILIRGPSREISLIFLPKCITSANYNFRLDSIHKLKQNSYLSEITFLMSDGPWFHLGLIRERI